MSVDESTFSVLEDELQRVGSLTLIARHDTKGLGQIAIETTKEIINRYPLGYIELLDIVLGYYIHCHSEGIKPDMEELENAVEWYIVNER